MAGAWGDPRTLSARHLLTGFSLTPMSMPTALHARRVRIAGLTSTRERLELANTYRTRDDGRRLPVQLLLGPASVIQPELRLMRAVLEDALVVLARPVCAGHPGLVAEAGAWLAFDDATYLFSFLRICEALDLDASRLRSRVASWLGAPSDEPRPEGSVRRRRGAGGIHDGRGDIGARGPLDSREILGIAVATLR